MALKKKLTYGITVGALALGAVTGISGAAFANTGSAPASTEAASHTAGHTADRAGWQSRMSAELATKLGVSQSTVDAALKEFPQAHPRKADDANEKKRTAAERTADRAAREKTEKSETAAERSAERTAREASRAAHEQELAKFLASKLGVSESKVADALSTIHKEHRGTHQRGDGTGEKSEGGSSSASDASKNAG